MPIQPMNLDVPNEIWVGLQSGKYKQFGSVIRDGSRIIMHLKEVDTSGTAGLLARVSNSRYTGPGALFVYGASGLVLTGGLSLWLMSKSRLRKKVAAFKDAFALYIDAIKAGKLDVDLLDEVLLKLETAQASLGKNAEMLMFSSSEARAIVELMANYTAELAEVNAVSDFDLPKLREGQVEDLISDLHGYLEAQQSIFAKSNPALNSD